MNGGWWNEWWMVECIVNGGMNGELRNEWWIVDVDVIALKTFV